MSLADAFTAALAKEKKAELVADDPEFKPLEKEIKINAFRTGNFSLNRKIAAG